MQLFYGFIFLILGSQFLCLQEGQAQTPIRFTDRDLSAGLVLVKPHQNVITINGSKGVFDPPLTLKYLGLSRQEFEIEYNSIAGLARIRFENLKGGVPTLKFENAQLKVMLPIQDNALGIYSRLGSISFKGVTLVGSFTMNTVREGREAGQQYLSLERIETLGAMVGSGVFRGAVIFNYTKKLLLNLLAKELEKILEEKSFREGFHIALLEWGSFNSGTKRNRVTPGSLQFYQQSGEGGLKYLVE